jgi:hypothetical protein
MGHNSPLLFVVAALMLLLEVSAQGVWRITEMTAGSGPWASRCSAGDAAHDTPNRPERQVKIFSTKIAGSARYRAGY